MKINIRKFLFPLLLIILYEIFAIRVYKKIGVSSFAFYDYFIIMSAFITFIASYVSDKYSRKFFLNISLLIAIILFTLIYFRQDHLVLYLSPLFFSTPIARAALIDNHEHFSVKNLMCIAYITLFTPWCFYSFFSEDISGLFIFVLLLITLITALIFKNKKIKTSSQNDGIIFKKFTWKKKYQWMPFIIGFTLVQIVFFLIFGKLEQLGNSDKIFDFMGIGLLMGSFFCFFLQGRHDNLILLSYVFLIILTVNSLASYFFWKETFVLKILIGETGIIGGIYLPLVTEKVVIMLGKKRRGLGCGLVEFITAFASLISLIGVHYFKNNYLKLLITVLALVLIACISQKIAINTSKEFKHSKR